eukprot:m.152128 g.152128  ORF g.152128 m.152128 type:complete len:316 (-) comp17887_c0_seq1:182-1129(-)
MKGKDNGGRGRKRTVSESHVTGAAYRTTDDFLLPAKVSRKRSVSENELHRTVVRFAKNSEIKVHVYPADPNVKLLAKPHRVQRRYEGSGWSARRAMRRVQRLVCGSEVQHGVADHSSSTHGMHACLEGKHGFVRGGSNHAGCDSQTDTMGTVNVSEPPPPGTVRSLSSDTECDVFEDDMGNTMCLTTSVCTQVALPSPSSVKSILRSKNGVQQASPTLSTTLCVSDVSKDKQIFHHCKRIGAAVFAAVPLLSSVWEWAFLGVLLAMVLGFLVHVPVTHPQAHPVSPVDKLENVSAGHSPSALLSQFGIPPQLAQH